MVPTRTVEIHDTTYLSKGDDNAVIQNIPRVAHLLPKLPEGSVGAVEASNVIPCN